MSLVLAGLVAIGDGAAEDLGTPGVMYGPETSKPDNWLERLMAEVVTYQALSEKGALTGDFQPYLNKLVEARESYRVGDHGRTYQHINEYMVMLEARVGGVDARAADALWDLCYKITPTRYHARDRHVRAHGAEALRQYEEFIQTIQERARRN
ncbi:hypothetical protein [Nitrospira sp. Kam-Ns4a]